MGTVPDKPDCYQSTLIISNLASDDMRSYKLMVENIHGSDTMDIKLIIQDPIPMAAVVGVTLTILITFLILVIALLIAYKKEKLCFKSSTKVSEEKLTENSYANEAYKMYLNGNTNEILQQKTLSSIDLLSSKESLSSMGHNHSLVHPKHVSLLPVGYTSYDNLGHNIYNSTQSLQYYNNYSLTPGHQ